ncbi:MAG: peptidylprolyl isomerase [Salinivirgaceae bacterium]|nr:peptidylprolyl isomerase [Salinivirgaceae bacterium]
MKRPITLLAFFALVLSTFAQQNIGNVLFTIDNEPVTTDEFKRIYSKNTTDVAYDSASVYQYLDLFVNYKLKVAEAKKLKYDTLPDFLHELAGYRAQLSKPYFTDPTVDDSLYYEAYDHMHWDVEASHILIACNEDAAPADTLKAYQKALKVRKEAMAKGADFNKLARKYSDDPSVEINGGYLGYFTAFSMVYPFEKTAYATQPGQVSDICRTAFGYHVIKVTGKRPNPGKFKVAHILVRVSSSAAENVQKAKLDRAQMIYDSLVSGASWNNMVLNYTDDRSSVNTNGVIDSYFTTGRMVPEFEQAAFKLQNRGDFSRPIRTNYGWHIVRLEDKKQNGAFEQELPSIKKLMSKDARKDMAQSRVISKLKKEYNFTEDRQTMLEFTKLVDSTVFDGAWDIAKATGKNKVIFSFDTVKYTQSQFAQHFANRKAQRNNVNVPIAVFVEREYNQIVNNAIIQFENLHLEEKYTDFKNLFTEYYDGILLFNITDKNVWSRANTDSVGLNKFYQANKDRYMWPERVNVLCYRIDKNKLQGSNITNDKAVQTITKAIAKAAKKNNDFNAAISNATAKWKLSQPLTEKMNISKYRKGENVEIDDIKWIAGSSKIVEHANSTYIYYVLDNIAPETKKLNECRGLVVADYQEYLEKEWLAELHSKHNIQINDSVVKSLITK